MVYPGNFHRLVVIGTLYGVENFNFTLNIVPLEGLNVPDPVDDELIDAVTADVSDWFNNAIGSGGVSFTTQTRLMAIKLNQIGPDGRYVDNETMVRELDPGIPGPQNASPPPQLSMVVTLRTARARGRGSRGRFYLPGPGTAFSVGGDGRLTDVQAQQIVDGVKPLIDNINVTYFARDLGTNRLMRVGVASDLGTGVFEPVTTIAVGRVVDTVRSRRSSLEEDYQEAVIAP